MAKNYLQILGMRQQDHCVNSIQKSRHPEIYRHLYIQLVEMEKHMELMAMRKCLNIWIRLVFCQ